MAKVLLVTDYAGVLHITPISNRDVYKNINTRVKTQQYKMREMEEKEAYEFVAKNNNIDPDFKTPQQVNKVLEDKDAEIKALREQLAAFNDPESETAKLRKQLAEMSTASTSTGAYANAGANAGADKGQSATAGNSTATGNAAPNDENLNAANLIKKIGEAKTADEVKSLVPETENRTTVIAARDKKLEELKK